MGTLIILIMINAGSGHDTKPQEHQNPGPKCIHADQRRDQHNNKSNEDQILNDVEMVMDGFLFLHGDAPFCQVVLVEFVDVFAAFRAVLGNAALQAEGTSAVGTADKEKVP